MGQCLFHLGNMTVIISYYNNTINKTSGAWYFGIWQGILPQRWPRKWLWITTVPGGFWFQLGSSSFGVSPGQLTVNNEAQMRRMMMISRWCNDSLFVLILSHWRLFHLNQSDRRVVESKGREWERGRIAGKHVAMATASSEGNDGWEAWAASKS